MSTAALQQPQVTARLPIHGGWDELFLYAKIKQKPGIQVAAPEFDAELHVETTTIMFADVVESVRLIEQDEIGNVTRIRALLKHLANTVVPKHQGIVLERRGDGLLIKFPDSRLASACALNLHTVVALDSAELGNADIKLRIGVHRGDVLTDHDALYGRNINLAARVASLANPGETVVTAGTRDLLTDTVDCDIFDLGECYVKHLDQPVRAYRISPTEGVRDASEPDQTDLRPTIAIIPPRPLTASPSDSLNAEVFADCVIAVLSKVPEFRVLSRLTTRVFQSHDYQLGDLREKLKADYALSGTVRFSGELMTVLLQLASTANGDVIWAGQIKGPIESLVDMDSEAVAGASAAIVTSILDSQIRRASVAKVPNLKSYSLLLAGIGLLHRQQFSEFDRARQMFEALSDRHPRHATPYAWQAAWRVFRVTQGWFDDLSKEVAVASDFARRAVDVDPEDSLSHTVSGLVSTNLKRDFEAAQVSFDIALKQNSNEPLAWLHRGALRAFLGEGGQAMSDTVQARSLSPLDPWNYYFETLSSSAAFAAGDYVEAVRLAMKSVRANRMHLSTLRVLAMANAELGRMDDATQFLDAVLKIEPTLTVSKYLNRSPSAGRRMAEVCASALRKAGLPE